MSRTILCAIPRNKLNYIPRVEPPEDVERREFSGPCFRCGERGICRHRRALFPESQAESATA